MGYDFESDQQYNFETSVTMIVELNKTCFAPGEYVNGTITVKPKDQNAPPFILDPRATLYLTEYAYYTYMVDELDPRTNETHFVSKVAEENIPLLQLPLDFSQYRDTGISSLPKLPFTCQIPLRIYPSCLFNSNTFVKHYLCIDFPSIKAKKTCIIVIKNPPYFSTYNRMYQAPAVCFKEMKKHKLLFSQGSFTATIKVPKNAFPYTEFVPFEIDIDLTKLSLNLKNIKVSLRRISRKNQRFDHSQVFKEENVAIAKKECNFVRGQKKIHIEDVIAIDADKNPKNIYNKLDQDKRKVAEKYKGVYLYPTCYGGLLSVEYLIRMKLEMDSMWSTNEEFNIPLDFFEPFANQPNMDPNSQPNMPMPNMSYPPQQPPHYIPPGGYNPQQPPQYPPQQPPQYPPQQPPQYPPQQPPQYPPQQPQYPPQQPTQYPPQQPQYQPQQPPQYPPQQPPQYPPQQPPQYPPQQPPQYPPQQPQYPPQQPQEQQNNNESLPTMDEILQKPVENNNNNNPPPPSTGGNNNNFNYPSF